MVRWFPPSACILKVGIFQVRRTHFGILSMMVCTSVCFRYRLRPRIPALGGIEYLSLHLPVQKRRLAKLVSFQPASLSMVLSPSTPACPNPLTSVRHLDQMGTT